MRCCDRFFEFSAHPLFSCCISSIFIQTFADRMYGVMAWIIPVLVACSCFGCANGAAFGGGRYVDISSMPSCIIINMYFDILYASALGRIEKCFYLCNTI